MLYVATIQCLRGMVTGCDNLLDDEYKTTLDTDLPQTAIRFRSVIDIMASDRVLFQLLLDACRRKEIDMDQALAAAASSMQTMARSGVQEASEEAGITAILAPDEVLQTVHHFKTGILFTCPWDIPKCLEKTDGSETALLLEGLYRVGMGCQVLDDMVDMASDLAQKRHNFVVSRIYHGPDSAEKERLRQLLMAGERMPPALNPAGTFPEGLAAARDTAREFLDGGLTLLFSESHRFLIEPAIRFLEKRIAAACLTNDRDGDA